MGGIVDTRTPSVIINRDVGKPVIVEVEIGPANGKACTSMLEKDTVWRSRSPGKKRRRNGNDQRRSTSSKVS